MAHDSRFSSRIPRNKRRCAADALLRNMEQEHERLHPDEPFRRPGFPRLAVLLKEAGYRTPKGHDHWWPAQVQQLLDGRFDGYYAGTKEQ